MDNSDTMDKPMSSSTKMEKDEIVKDIDQTKYQDMIGSLFYLIASRPDIMFNTCMCVIFQSCPKSLTSLR